MTNSKKYELIVAFKLRPAEYCILRELLDKDFLDKKKFLERHYAGRNEKGLSVNVSSLRKKLEKSRVSIETIDGKGYFLTTQNKERLRRIMKKKGVSI